MQSMEAVPSSSVFFWLVISVLHFANASQLCEDTGSLRLVGFETASIGSLEVCEGGVWGSVCASMDGLAGSWSRRNSVVACRQLGFEDAVGLRAKEGVHLLNSSATFPHYRSVQCSGIESVLSDCHTTPPSFDGCGQNGVAFVVCRRPITGDVRLIGSERENEGIVEVFNSKPGYGWGTICNTGWSGEEATIACRQLGYQKGLVKLYSSGSVLGWLPWKRYDNYSCTGSEATLSECSHNGPYPYKCLSSQYAGVVCSDEIAQPSGDFLLKVIIAVMLVLLLLLLVTMAIVVIKCGLARLKCKNQPSVTGRSTEQVNSPREASGNGQHGIARVSLDPNTWRELDPDFANLAPPSYEDTLLADQNASLPDQNVTSAERSTSELSSDVRLQLEDDSISTDSERTLLLAFSVENEVVQSLGSPSESSTAAGDTVERSAGELSSVETVSLSEAELQAACGSGDEAESRSTTGLFTA